MSFLGDSDSFWHWIMILYKCVSLCSMFILSNYSNSTRVNVEFFAFRSCLFWIVMPVSELLYWEYKQKKKKEPLFIVIFHYLQQYSILSLLLIFRSYKMKIIKVKISNKLKKRWWQKSFFLIFSDFIKCKK